MPQESVNSYGHRTHWDKDDSTADTNKDWFSGWAVFDGDDISGWTINE